MKAELLLDSFSYLDDELVARSERVARFPLKTALGAAACVALLVAALAAPPMLAERSRTDAQGAPVSSEKSSELSAAETEAAPVNDLYHEDGAAAAPALPLIERYIMDDGVNADACYPAPKNGEVNLSMPLRCTMDKPADDGARYRVIVELFRDETTLLPPDGAEAAAERERLAALGYTVAYETLTGEGGTYHLFTLHATHGQLTDFPASDAYGYFLSLYGERETGSDTGTVTVLNGAEPSAPLESTEVCGVPRFSGETLTEEAAYADADFGAYLCAAPDGFDEREFTRMNGVLTAHFLRGYEYVDWHVSRETDDPAVAASDLTPELVAARMYRADEAGDVGGPRIMNFCVDYGGVFVRVTAKGVSPEWLYGQLMKTLNKSPHTS